MLGAELEYLKPVVSHH